MQFCEKFLRSALTLALLSVSSFLLTGCPGGGAAREGTEQVATAAAKKLAGEATREGTERVATGIAREGAERIPRVAVSASEVNSTMKSSAETAASKRLKQIQENVEQRGQVRETAVDVLCDGQNFQVLSSQIYDAAYSAAYAQGVEFSEQGIPVSEEQVKELATSVSNEVISYYCQKLLHERR